jgi:phosphatidylserine/phosphatidylglycerophosphate/cardiolipin synthase-like enzyme
MATYMDDKHAIAHNKVMVIDGGPVTIGFFNLTKAAEENNAENVLVIHDPELSVGAWQNSRWSNAAQRRGIQTRHIKLAAKDGAMQVSPPSEGTSPTGS